MALTEGIRQTIGNQKPEFIRGLGIDADGAIFTSDHTADAPSRPCSATATAPG